MNAKSKTKIVCTIGPSTKEKEVIISLVQNGMNVARLNFSHGNYAEHKEMIINIREVAETLKKEIPIIADLGGPKVRIGKLETEISLVEDEIVVISSNGSARSPHKILPVTYENIYDDIDPGDAVLIDDGMIELTVTSKSNNKIYCRVVIGGLVKPGKGVNFPDSPLSTPSLTEKDKKDIEFALEYKLDFFALSFVRNSNDILHLKQFLSENDSSIPVIAKIEKPQAVRDIDQIIKNSDMIMIARGDLGVEMNAYEVPILQKAIIRKCLLYNKPVITATQMLESMINNPRSTRAEASDVANAVFDGSDAVMLSGETSIGKYPVAAVKTMHSILLRAENTDYIVPNLLDNGRIIDDVQFAIELSKAACKVAVETNASLIMAMTKSGRTARYLSKYRTKTPILAFSPNRNTITKLHLSWGVEGVLINSFGNTDEILAQTKEYALEHGFIRKNEIIVFVLGSPMLETEEINMIKIDRV